jgi:phosphoglycolate phosphatase/pyrophosphatase PpaX
MKINHVCFDLDGTLVDSRETIIKSTISALGTLNIPHKFNHEKFSNMIGLHFNDIFNEFNISVPDFDSFINIYKSDYFKYISDSVLYDGVNEVLKELTGKKIKISLLTTKGQDQADKLIDHFELRKYFTFVMGRRDGLQHKPSPESLLFICKEISVQPENTLMVGDTELDILCGKNAGAKTCAVSYGYRTENQLKENKPDFFINDLLELIPVLNNKKGDQ